MSFDHGNYRFVHRGWEECPRTYDSAPRMRAYGRASSKMGYASLYELNRSTETRHRALTTTKKAERQLAQKMIRNELKNSLDS
ncbi:MAG: hypothetical protein LBD06_01350 [Candidatus Accumulibacter sp.]|nr:hypothetical protein [Accumulibacter sp.]